jgi:hypothetical protein
VRGDSALSARPSLPKRRPGAGAVPGRWDLLGGKGPTGRVCFRSQESGVRRIEFVPDS